MYLTFLFSVLISLLFLAVAISFFTQNKYIKIVGERMMFSAPTILTSLGILGTFVGISYALLNFDTQNLDLSIPILLDGMKMAFLTSAIGIALSILLKIMMLLLGKENENQENKFIEEQIKKQTESLENTIPNILNAFISLSEKNQRAAKIFEKKLFKELETFSQNLTERTTQHIIEALEGVVINFNDSLSHQFGENFARLDESVKNMLKWQKNYKTLLDTLSQNHQLNAATLVEVKDSMLMIENSIRNIPELIKDFEKLIKFNQKQIGRIGEEMMIFTDIKDKALETFPDIQTHFIRMADNIEVSTNEFNKTLNKHTNNIGNNLANIANKMLDNFEENTKIMSTKNEQNYRTLFETSTKLQETLKDFEQILIKQLNNMLNEFSQGIEKTTQNHIHSFNEGMKEMTKENSNLLDKLLTEKASEKEKQENGFFGGIFKGSK